MIKEKMRNALNKQLNAELYSAYLYFSMSAYFKSINLPGFSNWMRVQALEEMTHADRFYTYLLSRGGAVELETITGPPKTWVSPMAVFEHTYSHEQKVTSLISDLVNLALEEGDHATNVFLQWFVNEQIEEESSADGILQKLKLIGKESSSLFLIDQELGQRVFTPPAAANAKA